MEYSLDRSNKSISIAYANCTIPEITALTMSNADSITFDEVTVPKAQRIELAHKAWLDAKGALSNNKAARLHGVNYSTLYKRINGALPKAITNQSM